MIGKTLGGRYDVLENIDSGGMAYVYKAKCRKTGNLVAVKVLKDEFAGSKEYVERFKREAQSAFSLEHDNVVHVYDVGFDQNSYYMVMEFVDGPTLKNIIDSSGFLPENHAIEYALQICSALSAAHKQGIIHRDIKPHNMLVDQQDNVKVTDFGIAKSVSSKFDKGTQVIGSVYYVSPEQAKGEKVDQRTDIYSFGIMLYEMLTGELPYKGKKTISVALKHINESIIPPNEINSEISGSLNNIILKATDKNKENRYSDFSELKKDLTLALIDKSGDFVQMSILSQRLSIPANIKNNNIWKIAIIAVTLVIFVLGGLLGGNAIFGTPQESPTPKLFINVPSIIGLDISQAQSELDDIGVGTIIVYQNNDDYPSGIVMQQSPSAGSEVLPQDNVTLDVSLGPVIIYMPNLIGMTETEAVTAIDEMGLVLESISTEVNESYIPGTVISQVPAADSDILEGSAVSLILSTEAAKDTGVVPQIAGNTLEQALSILNEAGFINTFVYQEDSDSEPGTVLRQSPEQGVPIQFDSDVDIYISGFAETNFFGQLDEEIEITDAGSKVKLVYVETIGEYTTHFKIIELIVEPGFLELTEELTALSVGMKKVQVYINGIPSYEFFVYFAEKEVSDEG